MSPNRTGIDRPDYLVPSSNLLVQPHSPNGACELQCKIAFGFWIRGLCVYPLSLILQNYVALMLKHYQRRR